MNWIAVALGGALGACLRYGVGLGAARSLTALSFPVASLIANTCGCLIMGFAAGWFSAKSNMQSDLALFVLVGVLGGFTTFSAFGQDAWLLLEQQRYPAALLHVLLHVGLGITLIFVGHWACRVALRLLDSSPS